MKILRYVWNVLISLDQLANTLTGGNPDETISSRAYRRANAGSFMWGFARTCIDAIFFWDVEIRGDRVIRHCELSFEMELRRAHFPATNDKLEP
ncbi:MAG: hypothetical protein CMF22_11185 [Idiomarinaceae bacterium]|nr:hypothetical protein [Idiomarinaceae bacterium]|tara:strand:+ start:147963 stop:148244 length:282 start_codon:yes stop_codon:yes gene_type:complete